MLLEERTIFTPRLGEVLVEYIIQRKEDFGWLVDDVIGPVNGEPDDKQEHRGDRNTDGWMGGPQGAGEGPTGGERQDWADDRGAVDSGDGGEAGGDRSGKS